MKFLTLSLFCIVSGYVYGQAYQDIRSQIATSEAVASLQYGEGNGTVRVVFISPGVGEADLGVFNASEAELNTARNLDLETMIDIEKAEKGSSLLFVVLGEHDLSGPKSIQKLPPKILEGKEGQVTSVVYAPPGAKPYVDRTISEVLNLVHSCGGRVKSSLHVFNPGISTAAHMIQFGAAVQSFGMDEGSRVVLRKPGNTLARAALIDSYAQMFNGGLEIFPEKMEAIIVRGWGVEAKQQSNPRGVTMKLAKAEIQHIHNKEMGSRVQFDQDAAARWIANKIRAEMVIGGIYQNGNSSILYPYFDLAIELFGVENTKRLIVKALRLYGEDKYILERESLGTINERLAQSLIFDLDWNSEKVAELFANEVAQVKREMIETELVRPVDEMRARGFSAETIDMAHQAFSIRADGFLEINENVHPAAVAETLGRLRNEFKEISKGPKVRRGK